MLYNNNRPCESLQFYGSDDLTFSFFACLSEWSAQKQEFKSRRTAFANSLRRQRRAPIQYPPELAQPFPKFPVWLNSHVRGLKEAQFPISPELESLHCHPSQHALCFDRMWAYGCHYSCNSEAELSTVAFDNGIAAIPPSATCTEIDVGILRNIILVNYGAVTCVLMEGSWIKTRDQGRRVVRKDSSGFWLVQYQCREILEKDNPYVFPQTVSQVFFISDALDSAWKVVLRHDPRSRRIQGEREVHIFGASGSGRPTLSSRSGPAVAGTSSAALGVDIAGEEVPWEQFNAYVREEEHADDEGHFEDTQFEDEFEVQYVE